MVYGLVHWKKKIFNEMSLVKYEWENSELQQCYGLLVKPNPKKTF